MAELNAPDIHHDLKVCSAYQYIKEIDPSLKDFSSLIEELIALEVAKYVLYHVSGSRPFDQLVPDSLGTMHAQKRKEFKEKTGKDYICINCDW